MGQTLTHGIYLPDEGERNCYNGLAANWQILDTSVGTIAEHSTQIAGKAPLVHTHTKSDVTDLLNSNFIPSANNSYDLGSSSYQWNNLYAKNYYYNGVAWGLDKANTWSANQTILKDSEALSILKRSNLKLGDAIPQTTQVLGTVAFAGSDSVNAGLVTFRDNSNGDTSLIILARQKYNSNGDRDPSGYQYETRMDIGIDSSRNNYIRPFLNGTVNLGTSTNKWKTLNGINPGALSFPDYNNALDVTSEIPVASLDGNTQIDINNYLPNKTGWLSIVIADTAGNSIMVTQGKSEGATAFNNSRTFHTGAQSNGYISVFFPILADMNKFVSIKASSLIQMRFYYCLGNV